MSKIKIAGNAVVVESALKLEDIKAVKKYRPNALLLMEGKEGYEEPVFAIDVTGGMGNINCNGAEFAGATESGNAVLTIAVCGPIPDVKKYVTDNLTGAIMNLNKLETQVTKVLEQIAADKKAVEESITTV